MFIIVNTEKELPWRLVKQNSAPQIDSGERNALTKCGVKIYRLTNEEFNDILALVKK